MTKTSVTTAKLLSKATSGYITIGVLIPMIIAIGWTIFYIGLDDREMSTKHFGILGQMATSWVVLGLAGSAVLPEGFSMVILRLFWLFFVICLPAVRLFSAQSKMVFLPCPLLLKSSDICLL